MIQQRIPMIRPGMLGIAAAADARRKEFDRSNEVILTHRIPVDFVFIGDSITHCWDLQAYFGIKGGFFVNRGIAGDISSHVLRRFDADVIQLAPKYVVIKIGVNNFWALDGWMEIDRRPPADIMRDLVEDIRGMVKKSKEGCIDPIICSILPTDMKFSGHDALRNQCVIEVNRELRQLASAEDAIYVDYHARLRDESGTRLREGLADDGLHPHVLGYDIMTDELRKTLAFSSITL